MRKIGATVVVLSMLASHAFAAGSVAPLTPGKPAGVQKAQSAPSLALAVVGAGIVAGGFLLATGGNNNTALHTVIVTSTTGTP